MGDSPASGGLNKALELTVNSARGGLNKALELTVNSARGKKSHSGEVDTDNEFCVASPQTREWFEGRYANTVGCRF